MPEKKPFQWQEDCIKRWFENDCRGIAKVVTGAGKTIMALTAARRLKILHENLKVKIVVPKIFLAAQWLGEVRGQLAVGGGQIGLYSGAFKDDPTREYMIYVINSARYALARHILADMEQGYPVLLICDECHHYASAENSKIFDFLPHINKYSAEYFSLGLSATPGAYGFRTVLGPALGKEIFWYDFACAVSEKIISRYSIYNIALRFSPREAAQYTVLSDRLSLNMKRLATQFPLLKSLSGTRFFMALHSISEKGSSIARIVLGTMFQRKELVHMAGARQVCACGLIERMEQDSKIIIFGERIETVNTLYERLSRIYRGRVGRYHSEMSAEARRNTLHDYQNSQTRILVCCRALDEGLDIPDADAGIVLSSTGSQRQRIQRIGRILRRSPKDAVKNIYYLYIADSSEDIRLVAGDAYTGMEMYDLIYDHATDDFYCPEYDALSAKVMGLAAHMPELAAELDRNLRLGAVRGGWRLSEEECRRNISQASNIAARNYWITMLRLIRARNL